MEVGIGESQLEKPSHKKSKSTTSDCWNFFTKIGVGKDGVERTRCNACKKEYKVGGHLYGAYSGTFIFERVLVLLLCGRVTVCQVAKVLTIH